jgi:DNA repair exonuclease SbcCD nuclease subunit
VRYLVLNDPHLDVKAPSFRRTDDYMAACMGKLSQIADICLEHNVEVLCCTGDWFHKKNPQSTPHRLVRALLEWSHVITDDVGIPIYTVLGNHDVQFNDLSAASVAKQPVGTLLTNARVAWLDHCLPMALGGVTFVGRSYRPPLIQEDETVCDDTSQFETGVDRSPGQVLVQLTHASVVPRAPVWQPYTLLDGLAAVSNADICHTGHVHEDLGIHQIVRQDGSLMYWTNVGSMTRGSLTEATVERTPKVLLVEVEPGEKPVFGEIALDCRPAEEIYDVSAYREEKEDTKAFTAWTSRLQEELNAAATTEKTLADLVQESTLDSRGRELALRILNEAGA